MPVDPIVRDANFDYFLFVVVELLAAGRKLAAPTWVGWGLTVGLLAGFVTEFVLASAGG